MTNYRRVYVPGATCFFTVNLAERKGNRLLIDHIDGLRLAFACAKKRKPLWLFYLLNISICPSVELGTFTANTASNPSASLGLGHANALFSINASKPFPNSPVERV